MTQISGMGCWAGCSNIVRLQATHRNFMRPTLRDFSMVLCIVFAMFYSVSVSLEFQNILMKQC